MPKPLLICYARREPSRWHSARYDTVLYWDQGATKVQARYPYHSKSQPCEGVLTHWVNDFGSPKLVSLEWLPSILRPGRTLGRTKRA